MTYRPLPVRVVLILWIVLALGAVGYSVAKGPGGGAHAVGVAVFLVLLAGQLVLAFSGNLERLAERADSPAARLAVALLPAALWLIHAIGSGSLAERRMLLALGYVLAPPLLLWRARGRPPGALYDYCAVLLLWLPIELGLLRGVWSQAERDLDRGLTTLFALNVAVLGFFVLRRLDGAGYRFGWARGWGRAVAANFLAIVAIVTPLGMAIGFIELAPRPERLALFPLIAFGLLLFNAWPEELLFRGLIQNFLGHTLRNRKAAWVVASLVFGLAHIDNRGFPNWSYVLLATVAGFFYGRTWLQTGSILPAALVHAMVNTTWMSLFRTL